MKKFTSKLRMLLYILPLLALALHFTALSSNAANTTYDNGKTLYDSYCAACHNNGTGGALPIVGVAGKGDDVSITKNAITTNKSRTGATTNMSAYSFVTDTQLQAITNYTYPTSVTMPLPTVQAVFPAYTHIETPVISSDYAKAYPIGAGDLNNNKLNWQVGLPAFAGQVDVYIAIEVPTVGLLLVNSNNQIVTNISPWRSLTSGSKTNESILENLGISGGNLSTSGLPSGTYTLYVAVLPKGDTSFSAYYLWLSQFTL